eukprot:g48524.t1
MSAELRAANEERERRGLISGSRSDFDIGLNVAPGRAMQGGGGDDGPGPGCLACLLCTFILLIIGLFSWDALQPTEYGLVYNKYTGYVNMDKTYQGGRHILGPGRRFIKFPATAVTVEFGTTRTSTQVPVDARTGRDARDPDSGGQPVRLHLSFIYQLQAEHLGQVYRSFSVSYESRYMMYARQSVSDVAQRFNPSEFWTERDKIGEAMEEDVRRAIKAQGGADVISLQLLRVDFNEKYEDTIVGIQLAVQNKTTNEYGQQVTMVLKQVDIRSSETEAITTAIDAAAQANATVIINNATSYGFNLVQQAKALSYARLTRELGFDKEDLVKYLRMRSIRTHDSANLVVGLQGPSSSSSSVPFGSSTGQG